MTDENQTEDTEAGDAAVAVEEAASEGTEGRRVIHDMWVAGTEERADLRQFTDEGSQEMLPEEEERVLDIQRGVVVYDDFELDDSSDEEELQVINMGPQHPSTHGVLRLHMELEGETIRRVKPIVGYLHTGMEKTAETLTWLQGPTNVTRMDYISPFHNELVYSLAVEKLLGVEIPERAQAIRILMTELNRVASHLLWVATQGMDIGAISMMIYGWREREYLLDFFEKVTGLRMNHNYIRPGGVAADLPDGWEEDIEELLVKVPAGVDEYHEILDENPIFLDRTQGVGILTPAECRAFGVTGPNARASGIDWDLRKAFPYSGIDKYDFDVQLGQHGDVLDRYHVRMNEIDESMSIARQILETMPAGDYRTEDRKVTPPPRKRIDESMEALIHHFKIFTSGFSVAPGEAWQSVESPRGELGVYIVSSGGTKPWRMHVRGPSFAHVQAMPAAVTDTLIADLVSTMASMDTVLGDVDR